MKRQAESEEEGRRANVQEKLSEFVRRLKLSTSNFVVFKTHFMVFNVVHLL